MKRGKQDNNRGKRETLKKMFKKRGKDKVEVTKL